MSTAVDLYLDLLKRTLQDNIRTDLDEMVASAHGQVPRRHARQDGSEWPPSSDIHTLIGSQRLDNIRHCIETVLRDSIPGDYAEAGTERGGACVFAQAVLKSLGNKNRRLWLANTFSGTVTADAANGLLAVPKEEVKALFERYGLWDENIELLEGDYEETLAEVPIKTLAVIRIDGDSYESTIQALENLYSKLSDGGFVIVDDYGVRETCKAAVDDFRAEKNIVDTLHQIDHSGVYWRRAEDTITTSKIDPEYVTIQYAAGETVTQPTYSDEGYDLVRELWLRIGWNKNVYYRFSWANNALQQIPDDVLMVQQVIWNVKPDLIIECGTFAGGFSVFLASVLESIGFGSVLSVDIDHSNVNRELVAAVPYSGRIKFFESDSVAEPALAEARKHVARAQRVLVILDSDHSYQHVLDELRCYGKFVTPKSYMIVMDGAMTQFALTPRGEDDWVHDNPHRAVMDYLKEDDSFQIDETFNSFPLTHAPDGYLQKLGSPEDTQTSPLKKFWRQIVPVRLRLSLRRMRDSLSPRIGSK